MGQAGSFLGRARVPAQTRGEEVAAAIRANPEVARAAAAALGLSG